MLGTIAIVLIILWLIGVVSPYALRSSNHSDRSDIDTRRRSRSWPVAHLVFLY